MSFRGLMARVFSAPNAVRARMGLPLLTHHLWKGILSAPTCGRQERRCCKHPVQSVCGRFSLVFHLQGTKRPRQVFPAMKSKVVTQVGLPGLVQISKFPSCAHSSQMMKTHRLV